MKKILLLVMLYSFFLQTSEPPLQVHDLQLEKYDGDKYCRRCSFAIACCCLVATCPEIGNDALCACGYQPSIPSWYEKSPCKYKME